MRTLRWSSRLHRWTALVVGVQVLLWIMGGLVMSAIPIERVRGEHKVAERPDPAFAPAGLLPLADAARAASAPTLSAVSLGTVLGQDVWRLTTPEGVVTVDARSGAVLSPFGREAALAIARADYAGPGAPMVATLLTDPPPEYGRPGPVWRVRFDDAGATTLYVDPASGAVRARRSSTWRFYDFFWRLHVMDYDDGADFNSPLLVTAAGASLLFAASGLVILVIRTRRSVLAWRARRRAVS